MSHLILREWLTTILITDKLSKIIHQAKVSHSPVATSQLWRFSTFPSLWIEDVCCTKQNSWRRQLQLWWELFTTFWHSKITFSLKLIGNWSFKFLGFFFPQWRTLVSLSQVFTLFGGCARCYTVTGWCPVKQIQLFPPVLSCDLLVVLCRQVNSVLVSSGGQVSLQTLDLLGVFLRGQKQVNIFLKDVEICCFTLLLESETFPDMQQVTWAFPIHLISHLMSFADIKAFNSSWRVRIQLVSN